jgi:hypothetical protein
MFGSEQVGVAVRSSQRLKVLALALAIANISLWFAVPWLRDYFDAMMGRLASPNRPMILNGVEELLVYSDPWLARGVFPLIYTLGFVGIAFLFQPTSHSARVGSCSTVAILLLSFETVWVFLIAFAILCRGPDWNFYWPWEAWVPKLVPLNRPNFSDIFWRDLAGLHVPDMPWIVREAPGLFLAAGYLSLGLLIARILSRGVGHFAAYCVFVLLTLFALAPLILRKMRATEPGDFGLKILILLPLTGLILAASYPIFRPLKMRGRSPTADRPMASWRCFLLVLIMQVAALVPLKMLLYWAFDLKYFVHLPEFSANV